MKRLPLPLVLVLALLGCEHHSSGIADPAKVVAVGNAAPDGQLTTVGNKQVALAETWRGHKGAVIVFYRGFY